MGRVLRIDYRDAIHHVMARGINGKAIFEKDAEKIKYLSLLGHYKVKHAIKLLAYCVMSNHVHLLLECDEPNLALLMHDVQSSYARWYNQQYKRYGSVFSGRYINRLCETQGYYVNLICYIHLNPEKAGIVDALMYPYSSITDYFRGVGYCDMHSAYQHLGNTPEEAIDNLKYYLGVRQEVLMLERAEAIKQESISKLAMFHKLMAAMDFKLEALQGNLETEHLKELRRTIVMVTHEAFKCSQALYASLFKLSCRRISGIIKDGI